MVSANTDPPSSFHYEFSDEWAIWVLDHGLPELPVKLGDDDDVPIAYWAGPRCGSVLFRSWYEDCEPSEEPAAEREVNTEHYSYWRTSDGWEATGGGGGTGGPLADPLARIDLPDDFARLGGGFVESGVAGRTGLVGPIRQDDRTVR